MNSALTYQNDSQDGFDLDHPFGPIFNAFRLWLRKNGFESITDFLVCLFFSFLANL